MARLAETIDAAPLVPPRLTLRDSVLSVDNDESLPSRWENGLRWLPSSCDNPDEGDYHDPCLDIDPTYEALPDQVLYTPFGIHVAEKCASMGQADMVGRVRNRLEAVQDFLIEREFWEGTFQAAAGADYADNVYLTDGDATLLSGPEAPIRALAELEAHAAAEISGRAVIHVTRKLATFLAAAQVVRREGNLLLTTVDTIVVPGVGYTGTEPTGDPAPTTEESYAFVTAMPTVRLGPVEVLGPGSNSVRTANTDEAVAGRVVAVTFDPCGFAAIRATLCNTQDC